MSAESNPQPAKPHFEVTSGEEQPKPASPARDRTLRHMRQLLAKAAMAGAAFEAGCVGVVCDPLPPPMTADCGSDMTSDRLFDLTTQIARWAQGTHGPAIEVTLDVYPDNLTFEGNPVLEGATLDGSALQNTELTLICTPAQGATTVKVSVAMKCSNNTTGTLRLVLNVSGTHQTGDYITITPAD